MTILEGDTTFITREVIDRLPNWIKRCHMNDSCYVLLNRANLLDVFESLCGLLPASWLFGSKTPSQSTLSTKHDRLQPLLDVAIDLVRCLP